MPRPDEWVQPGGSTTARRAIEPVMEAAKALQGDLDKGLESVLPSQVSAQLARLEQFISDAKKLLDHAQAK